MMMKMRKGATFIEYALLAGLVAIVVATAALLFGDKIKALFKSTSDKTGSVQQQVENIKFKINPENSGGGTGN